MITVQASKWLRISRWAQCCVIPFLAYLFWNPAWMLDALATVVCYLMITSWVISEVAVWSAERMGWIRFVWDDRSKRSLLYRMRELHRCMKSKP